MGEEPQLILGIDPGTRRTGYGLLRAVGRRLEPVDFGVIAPSEGLSGPQKHLVLFQGIEEILEKYKPDAVAVETQFVGKNVQSALKLGMARGVLVLAAARRDIPIFEYAPTKAKLAVVGKGSASKEQVQKMVQLLLQLDKLPEPEDAADALALAICHSHTRREVHVRLH
jgi:crossover junction endodeoxyribonuclease RuvC